MSLIGRFIGANKYQDQNIRDLTGAKRDALALWALFSDTIPEIDTQILTDAEADVLSIRNAISETLKNATSDDEVILFFSGHGSQDHRLAAYDTQLDDLVNSTVPMQELADLFKESKAKSIICILDCCFSGGAPAKVLETTPIARDIGNPLEKLAGKGRMILAASNFDQPSYELGATGHGILTKALIDTLQSAEDTVNLLSAMGTIMEIVRAEASKIGVEQTPVLLNHIEGGFTLPSLKPGANYFGVFPQAKGAVVSQNIDELSVFGLPTELLVEWKNIFENGLNELQLAAINDYRVLDGDSLLVIAPTSSGKTFIGELSSIKAIVEGKKAVFLLPYRALVNEKFDQFSSLYGEKLGYKVIRCTGDYQDQNNEFIKGKYDIALLTYEMFLNLAVTIPTVLNNMGLVVLDEAQFITDPTRGITVELLLTYLLVARIRGINPQIVVLSAVIGNSNYFEDWLGCKKLITTKRPVPLTEGVMDRNGRFKYLDPSGEVKEDYLLPSGSIHQRRDKPSAQDMIVPLVKKLVDTGEKVIVFRNQRGNSEGCAGYLSRDLGLESDDETLQNLPQNVPSSTSRRLKEAISGGVAFHDSNLTREERSVIERAFRNPTSKLRVLVATTTLAAGLNTPASTVILAEHEFLGEDGRPFTVAEYKNMVGRAGRVGFNEEGKSIILAGDGHGIETLFERYVMGHLESLSSSFDIRELDTWIIRLLTQMKEVSREDLIGLLANTYGGYINNRSNPDWHKSMEQEINELYDQMLKLNLVEEENGVVHLTLLGKACGESVFSFKSAMRLVELLRGYDSSDPMTSEALMALVQALPESDKSYTPMFKNGTSESMRQRDAANRYGDRVVRLLQRYTNGDEFVYYARCKKAAVLFDWINGVPTETIEETFKSRNPLFGNISYGDIRRFADLTRFQLRSAYKIASLTFPGRMIDENSMDDLLKQLEVGIPAGALKLLEIPVNMSREEYLSLYSNGIANRESLIGANKELLQGILEPATFQQVIALLPNTE